MTDDEQAEILAGLKILAEERKNAISEAAAKRRKEEVRHREEMVRVREHHRNANRVLIEAVQDAQARGVPKGAICEHIELTNMRLIQIERAIHDWDRKDKNAAESVAA